MPTIAITEPDSVTAGATVEWTKTLSDYPAGEGWTLKYALQGPAQIALTSTASGDAHAVSVTASTTAAWSPGLYTWTSFAESGSGEDLERHIVARGAVSILPSPLAAASASHAARTLALIEDALEGRIPRGLENTSIDGQSLGRIAISDLHRLREKYRTEVYHEQAAARARAGLRSRRTIGFRFTA